MRFASTVLYVKDVRASVEFYEAAFGLRRRHLDEDENGAYAELETGDTALALASPELVHRHLPIAYRASDPSGPPPAVEIALVGDDVHASYEQAVAAGARSVVAPTPKAWGMTVAFVRDPDGILIELASPTRER